MVTNNLDEERVNGTIGWVTRIIRESKIVQCNIIDVQILEEGFEHRKIVHEHRYENIVEVQLRVVPGDPSQDVLRIVDPIAFTQSIPSQDLGLDAAKLCAFLIHLPLILAWSMTIHRSMGMGFQRLGVDFTGLDWTHGLAYTALSRAKDHTQLYLFNTDENKKKIKFASSRVIDFYRHLEASSPRQFDEGHLVVTSVARLSTVMRNLDDDIVYPIGKYTIYNCYYI